MGSCPMSGDRRSSVRLSLCRSWALPMLRVRLSAAVGRVIERGVRSRGSVGCGFLPLILVRLFDHMAVGEIVAKTLGVARRLLARVAHPVSVHQLAHAALAGPRAPIDVGIAKPGLVTGYKKLRHSS